MGDTDVRREIEAAISRVYAETASSQIRKSAIVRPFLSRGVGLSTLYRWVDQCLEARKRPQTLIRAARKAAAVRKHRARASGEAPETAVARLAAKIIARAAVLPTIEVVAAPGMSATDVNRRLQSCIAAAEQVMAFARRDDGSVRMPKTLLAASEQLRRNLETAVKVHEAMRAISDVERFHDELIGVVAEVARKHPIAAELLLNGMRRVVARWQG
ncbi:MAG: hypothetical protein J0H91_11935 [Rhodospirillales bacterium]|nr:hypothetical protein [Rhodospirillales bacterium]